jgi:hypothetical protein
MFRLIDLLMRIVDVSEGWLLWLRQPLIELSVGGADSARSSRREDISSSIVTRPQTLSMRNEANSAPRHTCGRAASAGASLSGRRGPCPCFKRRAEVVVQIAAEERRTMLQFGEAAASIKRSTIVDRRFHLVPRIRCLSLTKWERVELPCDGRGKEKREL